MGRSCPGYKRATHRGAEWRREHGGGRPGCRQRGQCTAARLLLEEGCNQCRVGRPDEAAQRERSDAEGDVDKWDYGERRPTRR